MNVLRKKAFWITMIFVGFGLAILIGILIYVDFSYSITIVPLVLDERAGTTKHGLYLKISEIPERLWRLMECSR